MDGNSRMLKDLKSFPLLATLSGEDLEILAAVMQEKRFPAGTEILKEGEPGDEMFLLLEGAVDVVKTTPYGDSYVAAVLDDTLRCSFGEMSLIDRGSRSATVRARTDCRPLSLRHGDFREICAAHPAAGLELLMSVSATLVRDLRTENENLRLVYQALIEEIENN